MSKLICLSGPSGTGKSTLANNMKLALHTKGTYCFVFSTDNYFRRPDGHYSWSSDDLKRAHDWNYDKFKEFVEDSDFSQQNVVAVIDNTNLRWDEMKKYIELALLSKWEVEILRLECPFTDEELYKRNIHRVPVETIHRQREKWQSAEHFKSQLEILKKKLGVV